MRKLWPAAEAAQVDYEALREAALCGAAAMGPAAARFERAGLAGLIARPVASPVFAAVVSGAVRPPWTPYADPRAEALIDAYQLLLGVVGVGTAVEATS